MTRSEQKGDAIDKIETALVRGIQKRFYDEIYGRENR